MGTPWGQTLNIGVGDGVLTSWQLTDAGGFAINMPTNGVVSLGGVVQTAGTNYTLGANGVITFSSVPTAGAVLTLNPGAGYVDRLWIPQQAIRTLKPALWTAKFGDGYEQNAPQGINYLPESWDLQFTFQSKVDAEAWESFLDAQGAYQAFTWLSPRGPNPLRVLCQGWNDTTKPGRALTASATFRQVFGQ